MAAVELLGLDTGRTESAYRQMLESHNLELHFHDLLVWDVIASAIDAASADLSRAVGVPRSNILAHRVTVVVYHPLEKAIYVAVESLIAQDWSENAREAAVVERRIEQGCRSRLVALTSVSTGTSSKMLEWLDVLDLRRMVYLPYAA